MFNTRTITRAALIAALYAALTLLLAPISYGDWQCRVSEALTILPVLLPEAIPGLAVGCLIANLIGSATPWDIVFGTLATLLAALGTYALRNQVTMMKLPTLSGGKFRMEKREAPLLAALCPVVANGVIVGLVLALTIGLPVVLTMIQVAAGEAVAVLIGLLLLPAFSRVIKR